MGFLLKKFVSMFLMPLPLGVAFIILGLFFLNRNKLRIEATMATKPVNAYH